MKALPLEEYSERFDDKSRPAVPFSLTLTEAADLSLPRRAPRSHKYTYGRAVLIAGCRGFSGAPVLAANACERAGAGLTHLLVPESIYTVAAARCDGAVVTPLPSGDDGGFSLSAAGALRPVLKTADVCCIGPGLGVGPGSAALAEAVLAYGRCPLILDADALRVCAAQPALLDNYGAPVILTPHEGEFLRMGGRLDDGRLAGALRFTREHPGVILVLKGHGTLVCRGGEAAVNPRGTPAMAKGGSGDVLAGVLAALLAQGFDAWFAARCAVYLHGLAGELAAGKLGEYCVTPSDLTAALPEAFRAVAGQCAT